MFLHLRAVCVSCMREISAAMPREGLNPAAFPLAKLLLKIKEKGENLSVLPIQLGFPLG